MSQAPPLCVILAATLAALLVLTGRYSPPYSALHARTLMQDYDLEEPEDELEYPRRRRSDEELSTPWLGLGVLSDMQQFFDNLRTNLDSLESLPPEQRDALLGKTAPQPEKDQYFRPAATAAYLHAMRNQRPSYKIRNFVESPEPVTLRGTNHYDPSLLWTGLGRRKR